MVDTKTCPLLALDGTWFATTALGLVMGLGLRVRVSFGVRVKG